MRRAALCVLAGVLATTPAGATALSVLRSQYEPASESKAGRIELCGYIAEYFASDPLADEIFYISARVYLSFYPDRLPGFFAKMAIGAIQADGTLATPNMLFAYLRTAAQNTTGLLMRDAENANAKLLIGIPDQHGEEVLTLPIDFLSTGGTVGIQIEGRESDMTFAAPPPETTAVADQFYGCIGQGFAQLKAEAEAAGSVSP